MTYKHHKPRFPGWPVWDREDQAALQAALASGCWWWGAPGDHAGENLWEFQKEFASFQEAKRCIAAALLRTQLKKLPAQHALRNENARYLSGELSAVEEITVMKPTRGAEELGYYLFPFMKGIDYSAANWGGEKSAGSGFPVACEVYERSVQLPHYALLSERDPLDFIVSTIRALRS